MRSVAFTGPRGAGKTAIANLLRAQGHEMFSWALGVRMAAELAYGPVHKDRLYTCSTLDGPRVRTGTEVLQRLGKDCVRDHLDEDFWIKAGLRRMDHYEQPTLFVNDDTRFPNELQALRARGFLIAYVECDPDIRLARLVLRDGEQIARMDGARTHPSEGAVGPHECDVVVDNNGPTPSLALHALEMYATRVPSGRAA